MESSNSINLLVELESRPGAFWGNLRAALFPAKPPQQVDALWHDVFVHQRVPWRRFLQSFILHWGAVALIWMVSIAWLRQQTIVRPSFDRSSVLTYSPEEYLPPLDTGRSGQMPRQQPDPEYAKQEIISVPREADNRTQTIVAPPNVKLTHDVPLPNIVANGPVLPAVPIEATRVTLARMITPEANVVAPAPDLQNPNSRSVQTTLRSDVVAPPPDVALSRTRAGARTEWAIIQPPPEIPRTNRIGDINIGPAQVVAPAPQLSVMEQRTVAGAMSGMVPKVEPVAPPPSAAGGGGTGNGAGRLIALGIHPVQPIGPITPLAGNRRGTFAATPQGKVGASGTPEQTGSVSANGSGSGGNGGSGTGTHADSALPSGLHVGAAQHGPVGGIASDGKDAAAESAPREVASASVPRTASSVHPATPVPDDKVTDVDREVFGVKRFYSMTLNMPNLNSATGSWIIRFAELKANQPGDLLAPVATQKSDPGYPLELMRENVHGTVTLYAVIHSDGSVGEIRVINSPDERLEPFASSALRRWKFLPAMKNGKPVALEAVVMIPFRVKRNF